MKANISNEKIREHAVAMMELLLDDERACDKETAESDIMRAKAMCELVQSVMEIQKQETESNKTKLSLANMLMRNGYSMRECKELGYIEAKV